MDEKWWIDSDNVVQITGLKDVVTGNYINDATITATMADKNGNAVSGVGTITFTYTSGSNGDYCGEVPAAAGLTDGEQYTLTITAVGGGFQLVLKVTRRAAYKGP